MMSYTLARYRNRLLEKFYQGKDIRPEVLKNLKTLETVDLNKDILDSEFVVIDTELTGLDIKKDSILSIGAVKMSGSTIFLGNYFYRIVDPLSCVNPNTVIIHGITPGEAAKCPTIDLILPEFIDFCKNKTIVGYCVSIDIKFINKEMKRLYGFGIQNPVIDTLKLYQWYKKKNLYYDPFVEHEKDTANSNLFEIAVEFDVPVQKVHNAISDAFITAQIFQRFIPILLRKRINNLSELLRLGKP